MFIVKNIEISDDKKRISYEYTIDKAIAKFFNKKEKFHVQYQEEIATVPISIAVIPLLANIMPIAWFVGFDVGIRIATIHK